MVGFLDRNISIHFLYNVDTPVDLHRISPSSDDMNRRLEQHGQVSSSQLQYNNLDMRQDLVQAQLNEVEAEHSHVEVEEVRQVVQASSPDRFEVVEEDEFHWAADQVVHMDLEVDDNQECLVEDSTLDREEQNLEVDSVDEVLLVNESVQKHCRVDCRQGREHILNLLYLEEEDDMVVEEDTAVVLLIPLGACGPDCHCRVTV